MGPVGFEHPSVTVSKTPISEGGGAKSDAPESDFFQKFPDFADIINTSNLPRDFKKELITALKH